MGKQQHKTPLVRFPEFKDDWEVKKLIDLVDRVTTKNKENNSNICTISAKFGLISQLEYFNKSVSAKNVTGYYLLNKNDFAYNKSYSKGYPMGAIKRMNRYEKGVVSTLYICFRNKEVLDDSFAEHYYESGNQNKNIQKIAQEGARNHGLLNIGLNDFFSIPITFPQLAEQQKIAHFFSILDKKLTQLQKKKTALELYKKGMMQQIFSQQLRFKDENGNDFSDWEVKKLGNYIEVISGFAFKGDDISEDKNGIPLLRGINITEGHIRHSKQIDRFYNGKYETLEKYFLQENDLVIGMDGSKVGKNVSLITKKDVNSLLIQRVARLRSNGKSNINFVFQIIFSIWFIRYVDIVNTSSGIPHISLKQINDFSFNFPSLKEQTEIANFLSKIDEKINAVNQQIENTKTYKKGLLQKMFVN
tara:strand:- start:4122 stop:5372 length:1251 start_codon:yes stop_codon:yes gene_type:complete